MKILSLILSLLLIYSTTFAKTFYYQNETIDYLSLTELKEKYPNAKFIAIPKSEFNKIKKEGKKFIYKGQELIIKEDIKEPIVTDFTTSSNNYNSSSNLNSYNSASNISASADFIDNLNFNDDGTYVVLVIIGIFVVAVIVLDSLLILGDIVTNNQNLNKWFEISLTGSYFSRKSEEENKPAVKDDSLYGGLLFSIGLKENNSGIGIVAEVGYLDLSLQKKNTETYIDSGVYGMVGPTFRKYFGKKDNFHIDILVGGSELKQVDLMGITRVGLSFAMSRNSFIDFNIGLNYLGLKKMTDGYIDEKAKIEDNYNTVYGISIGMRF